MRLCTVNGKRALFHRWELYRAIVEYEDGSVEAVSANDLKFEGSKKLIAKLEKQNGKWQSQSLNTDSTEENFEDQEEQNENPEDKLYFA